MNESFGTRLHRLREERGWTVYEAAKRAGMVPWVLSRLEQRATLGDVQARSLKRLARIYEVTMDYLAREAAADEEGEPAPVARGGASQ